MKIHKCQRRKLRDSRCLTCTRKDSNIPVCREENVGEEIKSLKIPKYFTELMG
jgi:hypothetical protein